jgi:hypothetical protein
MHTEISPWIERLSPYRLVIAVGGAFLVLVVALAWVSWRWSVAEDRMAFMQKQAEAGFLQAPSSTRSVRLDLRAAGAVAVGGRDFPERVDLRMNARSDRYARFRVSLLREDGTLLLHADQLVRDSNQDLSLALNTSLLPAGRYLLRVEGYARGGKLERFAEARLTASGRGP